MNPNLWIWSSYVLGITSMFMTGESTKVYSLIAMMFYIALSLWHKGSLRRIMEMSILSATSATIFHWWNGESFTSFLVTLCIAILPMVLWLDRGEFIYEKKQIKGEFYYKQLGLSFMFPIVSGFIFALLISNSSFVFSIWILSYTAMLLCVRFSQIVMYNLLFIGLQIGIWLYLSTFIHVSIGFEIGAIVCIMCSCVLKIKYRRLNHGLRF